MRKLPSIILLTLAVLCFISCKKQNDQPSFTNSQPQSDIISVSIAPGETYTYNFTDAGKLSIVKQAAHFAVSTSQAGEVGSSYTYIPAANYTGSDEVVLQFDKSASTSSSSQLTNGCTHSTTSASVTSSFTTLKIQVGE